MEMHATLHNERNSVAALKWADYTCTTTLAFAVQLLKVVDRRPSLLLFSVLLHKTFERAHFLMCMHTHILLCDILYENKVEL